MSALPLKFRPGVVHFLYIGLFIILAVILFLAFGPLKLVNLGELGSRQEGQSSLAAEESWRTPAEDLDGDGFTNTVELKVGTDPFFACSKTQGTSQSAHWPADLNSTGRSFNKIDIQDMASFVAPVRRLNSSEGDGVYDARWDLNADGKINIVDMGIMVTFKPPMYGGQNRAFNGQTCTYTQLADSAKLFPEPPAPPAPPVPPPLEPPCYKTWGNGASFGYGNTDSNSGNVISPIDALVILQWKAGLIPSDFYKNNPGQLRQDEWVEIADVTDTTSAQSDGQQVGASDALEILKYIAGMTDGYPVCATVPPPPNS